MTIADLFPDFSRELQALTAAAGRPDLASQVPSLPVVARCTCGDDNCAHFYTEEPPSPSFGPGHQNLMLPATEGLIVLDLVGDRIVAVEVLDRPDVEPALDRYLPLT